MMRGRVGTLMGYVVAAGSSLSLKNRGVSPQEAARSLGVRFLLDGSVRKAGGKVRIAVKLLEGASGAQVWAERFEDEVEDLFELQDKTVLKIEREKVRRIVSKKTRSPGFRSFLSTLASSGALACSSARCGSTRPRLFTKT